MAAAGAEGQTGVERHPSNAMVHGEASQIPGDFDPSNAARVLAARAADPAATVADIARRAGVTDRTARRHLNGTPVG
ncbi:hypothetical protein [Micromonospora sp. NPDC005173]|uniref:hypothetical protein n=1 Tax=Micromonospora sp. NPDC005173 TaxID=3157165 RepID=UPI0033B48405